MTTATLDVLGGAQHHTRGFAPSLLQEATLRLLDQVRQGFAEYVEHLPLTLRQIFYRLVGAHGYEKTEQTYERLDEHLVRAHRARMIPMIRDDGGTSIRPYAWASAEHATRFGDGRAAQG